jgi:hypothetical protein
LTSLARAPAPHQQRSPNRATGVEAAKAKTLKVPIKDACQGSDAFQVDGRRVFICAKHQTCLS